jgi:hypothetical protein
MTGRPYIPGPTAASWIATARGALLALLSAVSLATFALACAAPALR